MRVKVVKLFLSSNISIVIFPSTNLVWGIWGGRGGEESSQLDNSNLCRRIRWCPWKVTTWVSRLGSENKPLLNSKAEGKWPDSTKNSRSWPWPPFCHLGQLLLGTIFNLVRWLPWCRSLQVSLDLLFHPYQKSHDLSESMLSRWCILRWERICFVQKCMGFRAEECPLTPYLPPSGKSLLICKQHSWRSGEYTELGVTCHPFGRSCEIPVAYFRTVASPLFYISVFLLLGSWIILKQRKLPVS